MSRNKMFRCFLQVSIVATLLVVTSLICFSSLAVAQDQDYKIYELFYDDLKQTESLAKNNEAFAQLILAIAYDFGDGVEVDLSRAADLYKKSAENGNGIAQYILSELYFNGGLLPINLEKGIFWLKQASDNNIKNAMSGLIEKAAHGWRGYSQDKNLAYKLCVKLHKLFDQYYGEKAENIHCFLGSKDLEKKAIKETGYFHIITAREMDGLDADPKEAVDDLYRQYLWGRTEGYLLIKELRLSAEQGSRRAMTDLARVYSGLGDSKTALNWYLKAAKLGESNAMRILGNIYSKDGWSNESRDFSNVSRNLKESKKYRLLEKLYGEGGIHKYWVLDHIEINRKTAVLFKAAEAGNAVAMYEIHNEGNLDITDKQRASLLKKSADLGYIPAMGRLLKNNIRGRYVLQNYTEAYKWALLGQMAKPRTAKEMKEGMDKLIEKIDLDKASINEAQRRAAAWLEEHPSFVE
jgi:TPR repeat protein